MKRALLIAGGTVGGLGAVLSITPPQLGSQGMANLSSSVNGVASTATASTASSQTTKAVVPQATTGVVSASASSAPTTPKATVKKKRTVATKKVTSSTHTTTSSQTTTSAPTPVVTKSAAPALTANSVSGTFAGSSVFVNYGTVQVEITVVNGKITEARALQAPTGRSDRFTQYAVPLLRQQTLAAQSANIQGASGASYTSYGWYTSLQVALAKAGL
ncbi:MAG: hypothetical protein Q8L08_05620 [Candidatus Nanopelagicaceae bacterium]|nr:hypothetical protein [Candidatus Nanopelagicaceae bacterium]